jgi:hypothetical protein
VQIKIAKRAIFSSLEIILKAIKPTKCTGENLTCKSSNVAYGIECTLCGFIYVSERKESLNKRMSGNSFQINNGGQQLLYKHFK